MYWIQSIENGLRRVNHGAVSLDNFIYSFGGYSNTEDNSGVTPIDIHRLNINTLKWTSISVKDKIDRATPNCRYGHTIVVYQRKFYLWGGRNDNTGACNRLFCFDPDLVQWSIVSIRGDFIPPARDGHSACLINDQMYIFGGFDDDNQQYSNELFYFDFNHCSWQFYRSKIGDNIPLCRDFHSATNVNGEMFVFGGRYDRIGPLQIQQNIYDNRLYVFHPSSQSWSIVSTRGETPCGRRSHSAFVYENKLYIFAGYNNLLEQHFNDLYQFDPSTSNWRRIHVLGLKPPIARRRQCCLVIAHRMFMFGGTSPIQISTSNREFHLDQQIETISTRLYDQSDLYVLDFAPTLKTLCLFSLAQLGFHRNILPKQYHHQYHLFTRSHSNQQCSFT